ncbi:MAG: zinc ABC transporter substrate-binding protein [Acidimicrobiales bacterium]|nr:zinc ABC transporter substrate-binding protein [Acidimicrobiales bacterium]
MSRTPVWSLIAAPLLLAGVATGCGSSSDGAADGRPTIVVTTSILGDVVGEVVGDQAEVVTLMPAGTDPHEFQASAQQANQLRTADVVVANGGGLEAGLVDVLDATAQDGIPVFEALDHVDTLAAGDDHGDEDHAADDGHDHGDVDPHFFTDPGRMAQAVDAMSGFIVDEADGVDAEAIRSNADAYRAELDQVVADGDAALADIPADRRVLVTDHEVFSYLADRFDLEVVGTVIPSTSTADGADARALAELADVIRQEDVPAIFTGTSTSPALAETLADEVGGDVAVVELYTGSLGEPGSDGATYLDATRSNLDRIAAALGGS